MPSHPEGLAIARVRIAEEKEKRTGFLDLGRLGLTELPEELFELEYFWGLNWGSWWRDGQEEWHLAASGLAPNQHAHQLIHLQRFPGLRLLSVSQTDISDLSPLAGLSALQSLNCSQTLVSDLGPLAGLSALQSLDCSETQVSDLPGPLVRLESLKKLILFNTHVTDIPAEVLSPDYSTDCLESLRAHLRDLEVGEERLPDVKVLVLGNGRIGKTQICRRLRGEAFDPSVDSTHGILVTSAMLPENAREYEQGGITFRNHPLVHWLEYVSHMSGVNSPVLIVQNMCDQAEDEALRPPVEDEALRAFPFRKVLHYSALKDRGRGALNEALQQAILWLRKTMGQARIGKGRLAVKRKLEALRDEDVKLPAEQRKYYPGKKVSHP